jgi:hypothetical protein
MKWLNFEKIRLMLIVFVAAVVLSGIGLTQGATITVGSGTDYDYDTIQAGIDAANDGDEVLVALGEYVITEPITFRGKAITVKSEAGRDETTIRMGTPVDTDRGSVVIFEDNETTASVLEGFTITGGRGSWWPSAGYWGGGGIGFDASAGTVRNCAVVENTAKNGGGVFAWAGASPTLTNCIISVNSATGVDPMKEGNGGGLGCGKECLVTLTDCTVAENSAGTCGGGLWCGFNSSVTLTQCAIMSNRAGFAGGGTHCYLSSLTLANCVIARNTAAELRGGGVNCPHTGSSTTISNCTIWGNSAGQHGGGVACFDRSGATVTNSIVWANVAPQGREISAEDAGTVTVTHSNVAGGQTGVNIERSCTLIWGEGNIDADPLFVDTNNEDFHLKSKAGRWDPNSRSWVKDDVTSPCIDAGDPLSPIGLESFPNGGFVNIGAYGGTPEASKSYFGEPICETIIAGDINGDCQVDRADLDIMALHWTDDEPLLP